MKLERRLPITIMINLLLLQNLIRDFFSVTPENFAARLAQGNLASKNDIAVLVKIQILMKNQENETKMLL